MSTDTQNIIRVVKISPDEVRVSYSNGFFDVMSREAYDQMIKHDKKSKVTK